MIEGSVALPVEPSNMLALFRGINGRILLIPIVALIALAILGTVSVRTIGSITLEQHPPLESARSQNRKPGQDPFPQGPEIGRHQRHPCQCVRERARFGDGLVQKDPAIKRLMRGANDRKPGIGVEILAREVSQPQRQIGKLGKPLGLFRVCDKTSRIDENLAFIETRVKDIAEQLGRIGHAPF